MLKTKEALQKEKYSIYTGTTKRSLKEEADQFLNRRGYNNLGKGKVRKPYKGQRYRPVLLSKCTRKILNAQERKAIDIKSAFVFNFPSGLIWARAHNLKESLNKTFRRLDKN